MLCKKCWGEKHVELVSSTTERTFMGIRMLHWCNLTSSCSLDIFTLSLGEGSIGVSSPITGCGWGAIWLWHSSALASAVSERKGGDRGQNSCPHELHPPAQSVIPKVTESTLPGPAYFPGFLPRWFTLGNAHLAKL